MLLAQALGQLHLWLLELLALLRQVEVVRRQGKDGGFVGHEPSSVFLLVVGQNGAVLLIDEGVVTFLGLAGLHSCLYPLLELQVLAVGTAIQSKLEVVLTPPKLFRTQPVHFPPLHWHLFLVLVVVVGVVGFELRGVAVFIQQELGEVVVLKGKL